jgi:FkbM family methyltransferase
MSMFRDVVRRGARRLRIEGSAPYLKLKKLYPRPSEISHLAKMLAWHKVTVVFDIGANVGQFARELRLAGFAERIVSFEPLSNAHARLLKAAKGDANWTVAPQMAIGSSDTHVDINIAGDSVSSSVLGMLDAHLEAAPDSAYVGTERVRMRRLDTIAREYLRDGDVPFVKVDVQGCEAQVLEGAREFLRRVIGLHLELALVPCYREQHGFGQVASALGNAGFSLWLLSAGTVDERTGRQLQVDAVFFRDELKDAFKDKPRGLSMSPEKFCRAIAELTPRPIACDQVTQ